jgi:uncharacterized protein (DUF58 family)
MQKPLLDRRFLEQLERLTLRWNRSFQGLVGGHNMSRFSGPGQEFLDHRTFHPGDDLRAVNWRAFMRFEKLFLKMFQIEPRVPVRLLLDVSTSMQAGSDSATDTKFDYGRRLAAALVYVGLVRLDSILLQPFAGNLMDPFLASGGRHRFQPAEIFLRSLKSNGTSDYLQTARQYLSEYPQRGLTIVLSDFLGQDDCLRALQYLADFGNELLLVHIWTKEDRSPSESGEIELVEAETGAHLRIELDDETRTAYTAAFDDHAEQIRKLALRNGGRYLGLSTDTPLMEAMFGSLNFAETGRNASSLSVSY